mmetsp:Transcript_16321/g.29851  ORF Transcript_16321/g.29851 Transcript_16321/m.29851 type:complete len:550 (+) Transcript_16321:160-1809(+)
MAQDHDRWVFIGLQLHDEEQDNILKKESEYVQQVVGRDLLREEDIYMKVTWETAVDILSTRADDYVGIDVIVIAGHGTSRGLSFGETVKPQIRILARLLAQIDSLKLLILNCCETEELAHEVRKESLTMRQSDMVIFCWSTEVDFYGAAEMNKRFCASIMSQLKAYGHSAAAKRGIGALEGKDRQDVVLKAFQVALFSNLSVGDHFIPGPMDQTRRHESLGVPLGEPMLLPFISTREKSNQSIMTKHKVADTGIQLIKQLKALVRRNPSSDLSRKTPTFAILFKFGDFLAWLHILRHINPEPYLQKKIKTVEKAFSSEDVQLCGTNEGLVEEYTGNGNRGKSSFIVSKGCFTLKAMELRAIAEVMQIKDSMQPSVMSFIEFKRFWRYRKGLVHLYDAEGDSFYEEIAELKDAFSGLEQDVDLFSFAPSPTLSCQNQNQSFFSRCWSILGTICSWFRQDLALCRVPFIRIPLPIRNVLYATPNNREKELLRPQTNVYRRMAWIHDSILQLVTAVDPKAKADVTSNSEQSLLPFLKYSEALYPNTARKPLF